MLRTLHRQQYVATNTRRRRPPPSQLTLHLFPRQCRHTFFSIDHRALTSTSSTPPPPASQPNPSGRRLTVAKTGLFALPSANALSSSDPPYNFDKLLKKLVNRSRRGKQRVVQPREQAPPRRPASLYALVTSAYAAELHDTRLGSLLVKHLDTVRYEFPNGLLTWVAVVDKLPVGVEEAGGEGIAYHFMLEGDDDADPKGIGGEGQAVQADTAQMPGFIRFETPSSKREGGSGGDGDLPSVSVQLPLAKTIFSTGRISSLRHAFYERGGENNRDWELRYTHWLESATFPLPAIAPAANANLHAPLVPLTPFRTITKSMGNIIRTLQADPGSASQPASQELEAAVSAYFADENLPPAPVSVWALTVLSTDILPSTDISPSTDALPSTIQTLSTLLASPGARLSRVLSGGGGWGKKAGLLSLDPDEKYSTRGLRGDEGWGFEFGSGGEEGHSGLGEEKNEMGDAMREGGKVGEAITFLLAVGNEEAGGMGQAIENGVMGIREGVWEFGVLPSSIDAMPEMSPGVENAGSEGTKGDNNAGDRLVYREGVFGALSEGGLALTVRDASQKVLSQTKFDVPFSRVALPLEENWEGDVMLPTPQHAKVPRPEDLHMWQTRYLRVGKADNREPNNHHSNSSGGNASLPLSTAAATSQISESESGGGSGDGGGYSYAPSSPSHHLPRTSVLNSTKPLVSGFSTTGTPRLPTTSPASSSSSSPPPSLPERRFDHLFRSPFQARQMENARGKGRNGAKWESVRSTARDGREPPAAASGGVEMTANVGTTRKTAASATDAVGAGNDNSGGHTPRDSLVRTHLSGPSIRRVTTRELAQKKEEVQRQLKEAWGRKERARRRLDDARSRLHMGPAGGSREEMGNGNWAGSRSWRVFWPGRDTSTPAGLEDHLEAGRGKAARAAGEADRATEDPKSGTKVGRARGAKEASAITDIEHARSDPLPKVHGARDLEGPVRRIPSAGLSRDSSSSSSTEGAQDGRGKAGAGLVRIVRSEEVSESAKEALATRDSLERKNSAMRLWERRKLDADMVWEAALRELADVEREENRAEAASGKEKEKGKEVENRQ